jgi:hypothetical protein
VLMNDYRDSTIPSTIVSSSPATQASPILSQQMASTRRHTTELLRIVRLKGVPKVAYHRLIDP